MIALDIFCGIGGFSEGARQAGARVIAGVDLDTDALEWHQRNHDDAVTLAGDLTAMPMDVMPPHDLLLASPSCRGFSSARTTQKREDRDAARDTAWAVIRAVAEHSPKYVIVENVRLFTWWDRFDEWCREFAVMGYGLSVQVVNARDFGGSQDRARTIVIACRDGEAPKLTAPDAPRRVIEDDLLPDDSPELKWVPLKSKTQSIRDRIQRARDRAGNPDRFVWANVDSARARDPEVDGWPTLTTRSLRQLYVIDGDRIRMVDSRELARAMGLPDTFLLPRKRTVSGRLLGNAIPVPVSRAAVQAVMTHDT